MPKKLYAKDTFDAFESEVLFTQAALAADPEAAALGEETADWLGWVDAARAADRAFRLHEAKVDARRIVANGRLDAACVAFGRRLLGASNQDRQSPRFKRFFSKAPSVFVRQALDKQIASVFGWLATNDEPTLEEFRGELTTWASSCRDAQDQTAALGPKRGENEARRAKLAEDLTRERDALHRELSELAAERGLARDWADLFFRTARRPGDGGEDEAEPGSPPVA